mmetsp:Transcript_13822/g.30387  ORF Transcript_13822/g.30387 Transcript_13822/m.30387 type:complete len:163 (-) Transcript_13822:768-1256(-)
MGSRPSLAELTSSRAPVGEVELDVELEVELEVAMKVEIEVESEVNAALVLLDIVDPGDPVVLRCWAEGGSKLTVGKVIRQSSSVSLATPRQPRIARSHARQYARPHLQRMLSSHQAAQLVPVLFSGMLTAGHHIPGGSTAAALDVFSGIVVPGAHRRHVLRF